MALLSMPHLILVSLLLSQASYALSIYPVRWSSKTYGLDGPWYAVSAWVGGYDQGYESTSMETPLDLMPGGIWCSTVVSPRACNAAGSPDCGEAGTWDPKTAFDGKLSKQTSDGQTIGFEYTENNFAGDMRRLSASVYAQRLRLNDMGLNNYPNFAVPNATLVVTENATMQWPNGRVTGLNIGNLALGADGPRMNFTKSDKPIDNIVTYNVPGYLSLTNQASNSYAIQLGSTHLKYPPSLIFGGYDKGRGLGPVASWSSSALMLSDIVLGVETGGSPWDFTSKEGLLLNNMSKPEPLPVYPEPLAPYLHLPENTCQNLAQYLPIYFDAVSRYYLWNTSDPSYTKVVTSAAYLGFVFPPSYGNLNPVTIKVPMIYLNLTLQPGASGLPAPVAYFPCQNYRPDYRPTGTAGAYGGSYTLGRAFLQAAILGRNWSKGISWLAQAPGPGSQKQGLGYNPQTIGIDDTTISFSNDPGLFNSTMQGYWKPLPGPSVPPPTVNTTTGNITAVSASATASPDQGLSTGAKAGIGVGAAVGAVALILLGVFLYLRKRKRSQTHAMDGHDNAPAPPYETSEANNNAFVVGSPTDYPEAHYKYPDVSYPQEMSTEQDIREIDSRAATRHHYELSAEGR